MYKEGLSFKEKVKEARDRLSSRWWVIRFVLYVILGIIIITNFGRNKDKKKSISPDSLYTTVLS